MNKYRETLDAWAALQLPEGAKVVSVHIEATESYHDPTYGNTIEGRLDVVIRWTSSDDERDGYFDLEILSSIGELLTQLFAIEET